MKAGESVTELCAIDGASASLDLPAYCVRACLADGSTLLAFVGAADDAGAILRAFELWSTQPGILAGLQGAATPETSRCPGDGTMRDIVALALMTSPPERVAFTEAPEYRPC